MAELGIILIAFEIGREVGTRGFTTIPIMIGIGELTISFSLAYGIGRLIGLSLGDIIVLASIAFISSTAISYRLMEERGHVAPKLRTLLFGVMAVEDAIAVSLLTLMKSIRSVAGVVYVASWTIITAVIMATAGFYIIRKVLSKLDTEAFGMVAAIALSVVYASIATLAGLSPALGAFVAGLAFSAHPRVEDIAERLAPVRELFLVIFFISIGLSIPTAYISPHILAAALVLSGLVVLIRFLSFTTAAWMLVCGDLLSAIKTGFYVLTVGEFSLIIAYESVKLGVASNTMLITATIAVVLAAVFASILTKNPERYAGFVARAVPPPILNLGNIVFTRFRISMFSGTFTNFVALLRKLIVYTAELSAVMLGAVVLLYFVEVFSGVYAQLIMYLILVLALYPLYNLVRKVVRESREIIRELLGFLATEDVVNIIGELLAIAFLAIPAYLSVTLLVGYVSERLPLELLRTSVNLAPLVVSAVLLLYGVHLVERIVKSQQRKEPTKA